MLVRRGKTITIIIGDILLPAYSKSNNCFKVWNIFYHKFVWKKK